MTNENSTHIALFEGKSIRRKLVNVRKINCAFKSVDSCEQLSDFSEHPKNPLNKQEGFFDDKWFFSVVNIVGALTDSEDPRKYWNKLSQRLREEGSEVVTFCHQLKLKSGDGKEYETDCADTEGIFRIIQSIPSKKAEPFKRWLARVGYERVQEIENPKIYKSKNIMNISNLRIVSMIPGDSQELPDAYIFSNNFGGSDTWKIASKWIKLNENYFENN